MSTSHASTPTPPSLRRFDLVRCDGCGEAQIANGRFAVCPRCLGTSFHRVTPRDARPTAGWS